MFSILKTIIVGTRQMRAAKVFKISLKSGGEKVPASTNNRNEDRWRRSLIEKTEIMTMIMIMSNGDNDIVRRGVGG